MAHKNDMVLDITPSKLSWNLRVTIVRLWEVPDKDNKNEVFTVEMVVQDDGGNRIHCTVPKNLVRRFRPVLHEQRLYLMKNFLVRMNNLKIKTAVHKYKLSFLLRTIVEELQQPTPIVTPFKFVPIKNLVHGDDVDENILLDVIGVVVVKEDVRPMQTYKGETSQRMVIHIEDCEKNRLACTLFGELVDKVNPMLSLDSLDPTIVCLQFFKTKKFGGKFGIQSSFYASEVHVNPDINDVHDFKARLLLNGQPSSQKISFIASQSYLSVVEEFERGMIDVKSVEDVINSEDEMACWIVSTIVALDCGVSDWYYHSCSSCKKKVDEMAKKFYCRKCDRMVPNVMLRFKIQVVVTDGTGTISLILWDKEALHVIGRTAKEVKESAVIGSDQHLPMLEEILDRKLLFKINIKAANLMLADTTYNVLKISSDLDHIAKYSSQVPSYDVMGVHDDASKEWDGGISQACSEGAMIASKDQTDDSENLSKLNTPVKRCGYEVDDPTVQMSSNKLIKVNIKKE